MHRVLQKTSVLLGLLMLASGWLPASAGDPIRYDSGDRQVTLLEVYSSQGCARCPPAEQWVSELKEDDRLWQQLVPVVFHVDYWDHLGWADPYASIKHTQRQRLYQLHGHFEAVYTPGFVLAGDEWRGWFSDRQLPELVAEPAGRLQVEVSEDKKIKVRFVRDADNRNLKLHVAVLGFDRVTEIGAGANAGRELVQDFVVLSYRVRASDSGSWNLKLPGRHDPAPPAGERKALAFWVSQGSDPAPLQATGGWYP